MKIMEDVILKHSIAAHVRVPLLPRLLAKKRVERGLSSIQKHMKEEGENLKMILEADV